MYVLLASLGILTFTIIIGFIFSRNNGLMGSDYPEDILTSSLLKDKTESALASGSSFGLSIEDN